MSNRECSIRNSLRECSFRGVRVGEVFVPLSENRSMHNYSLSEDRESKRVSFTRVIKPGRFAFTHKTYSDFGGVATSPYAPKDNRQYVKTSDTLAVCLDNGADAIFGFTDRMIVIGHIDDQLKAAA